MINMWFMDSIRNTKAARVNLSEPVVSSREYRLPISKIHATLAKKTINNHITVAMSCAVTVTDCEGRIGYQASFALKQAIQF